MTPCLWCGTPFDNARNGKSGRLRRTCSKECARLRDNKLKALRSAGINPPPPRLAPREEAPRVAAPPGSCLWCSAAIPLRPGKGSQRRTCSEECRRKHRAALSAKAYAARHPNRRAREVEQLGPPVPLDGLSDKQRLKRLRDNIIAQLRDGLSTTAAAERFDVSRETVNKYASEAGVSTSGTYDLPYGVPAP